MVLKNGEFIFAFFFGNFFKYSKLLIIKKIFILF